MKIRILASASQDLIDGYRFYEKQAEGLGSYFLDSLFSDIDSLAIYAGIHSVSLINTIGCYPDGFLLLYIIASKTKRCLFMPSLTAAAVRLGQENT